jgi:hypothetical protein
MHPFDHNPDSTQTITGSWNDWANRIDENYLSVCKNKTVLEIACGSGNISRYIVDQTPKSLILIDLGVEKSPVPETNTIKFISDDVHQWLPMSPTIEVVVCFGFLYHLHSPLHLLELIVNYCDPKTIILDNVVAPHPLAFNKEINNRPGQRYVKEWKYCPFNMPTPFFIINQSLDHMGYKLDKSHHLRCEPFPKSNGWVASWTKR